MNKKKIIISVLLVIGILVTAVFTFYHHTANNPQLFVVSKVDGSSEDSKFTHMNFVYATAFNISLSEKLTNNLYEIAMWNDSVIVEIMQISVNAKDLNINCSYNETKTQVTVTYQGSYVDENDKIIEYYNERTFDFILPVTENQLAN